MTAQCKRWHRRIFALALFFCFGTAALADRQENARPDKNGGLTGVASVDMNRLYALSDAPAEYNRQANEVDANAEKRLQELTPLALLTVAELQQYLDLGGKETLTPEEQQKKKDLQTLAGKRVAELQILQGKAAADLSAADKTRLNELIETDRTFNSKLLPNIEESLRQTTNAKMAGFRMEQMAKIRAVVGQVAKQKGFSHVFDVTVLIYCENDLTTLVLQRLNKHGGK